MAAQELIEKKNQIIEVLIQNCADAGLTVFETECLLLSAKDRIQKLTQNTKIGLIQDKSL